MQNNSLAYLDCSKSMNDANCINAFNNSIEYALKSYLGTRPYLLRVCGVYNSSTKDFKKAIPYYLNLSLSYGNSCEIYFSIYAENEISGGVN